MFNTSKNPFKLAAIATVACLSAEAKLAYPAQAQPVITGIPETITVPLSPYLGWWGNENNCFVSGPWDYLRVKGMGLGYEIYMPWITGTWGSTSVMAPFDITMEGNRTSQLQNLCFAGVDYTYGGGTPDYPFVLSAQACTNDGQCGPEVTTIGTYSNDTKESTTPMARLMAVRGKANAQVNAQP
jgi:hypothetical protein